MVGGGVNARGVEGGDLDGSFVWAGQAAGLVDVIEDAGAVVARMAAEAASGLGRLDAMLSGDHASAAGRGAAEART